ncbi:hypothetical protein COOONC_15281 [Cooperia oncophora]
MKVVTSHRKKLAEEQTLYQAGPSRQVVASRLRTFYFVFMTTVFTAATLLPFRISSIIMSFSDHHEIFNPLITVTVLPQYRCRPIRQLLSNTTRSETKPTDL